MVIDSYNEKIKEPVKKMAKDLKESYNTFKTSAGEWIDNTKESVYDAYNEKIKEPIERGAYALKAKYKQNMCCNKAK